MTPEKLRDGIFAMNTRRFGSVAEIMVKRLVGLGKHRSRHHDLFDEAANLRVEAKFSAVRAKNGTKVEEGNVLACIEEELSEDRQVRYADWKNADFDCAIQQVKPAEFDVLYYGLFFHDAVVIFKMDSSQAKTDAEGGKIGYSDKQHKGNQGEGQFHLSPKTLAFHVKNRFHAKLSYAELLALFAAQPTATADEDCAAASRANPKT